MDPELLALLRANGATDAEIAALAANSGGGGAPSSSPPVYFGETRAQTSDGDVLRARGGKNKFGGTSTKTIEQANAIFFQLSPTELMEFQRRIVAAGIVDPSKIRLGDYDEESEAAWGIVNMRAAKFYASGKKVTPNDVLSMIEAAYDPRNEPEDVAAQRRNLLATFGTNLHTYNRSDPAALRITAETAFRQALGRKPKKDELEKFVSTFLKDERTNQADVFAAEDRLTSAARNRALSAFDASAAGAAAGKAGNRVGPIASPEMEAGMSEADVLWNRLQRMVADSPYEIGLGKRDRPLAEQKRLYANWKAGKGPRAAKPGTSKHGDGRANDLKYSSDKARQWVIENAHKYGLALPLYDPKLPRHLDESWHVEVLVGPGLGTGRATASHAPHAGHVEGDAPAISTTIIDQQRNAEARAIEYARNVNPTETAAYDIGGQFNNLLGILQKGVV